MPSSLYLSVRAAEGRVYSDDVVAQLPQVPRAHPLWAEWQARAASAARLVNYLRRKPKPVRVLDLGCGNGWLAAQLARVPDSRVCGLDVNLPELAQAARVFHHINFVYADLTAAPFATATFDVIVLASVIQYFADLPATVRHLQTYLAPRGEIHIVDSPLYAEAGLPAARARTHAYYTALGFPAMAAQYHHHPLHALDDFAPTRLYTPRPWLMRLIRVIDTPFPWIKLTHAR